MALWIPAIVVLRSSATVAIETFITELSSAIRNCPAHKASSTVPAPCTARVLVCSDTWHDHRAHGHCPLPGRNVHHPHGVIANRASFVASNRLARCFTDGSGFRYG